MGYVETQLDIDGMTCASCVARVEKGLARVDGVEATVNLATARATVRSDEPVPVERLVAAVREAGYDARPAGHVHHAAPPARGRGLVLPAALSAPVVLLAMVPPLQFSGWEWAALALATPVVLYAGAGFHRVALQQARHGAATMDTLISLGTLAAWLWSVVVLAARLDADTYFEVAAV